MFDILKIGVGPSSSHTLGPWRAAADFVDRIEATGRTDGVTSVRVELFGSLAKTGHGTGSAAMLGLAGHDPATCDVAIVQRLGPEIADTGYLLFAGTQPAPFVRDRDIVSDPSTTPDAHPNALRFTADLDDGESIVQTSFSVGGGFIVHEDNDDNDDGDGDGNGDRRGVAGHGRVDVAVTIEPAADLERAGADGDRSIAEVGRGNERAWRTDIDRDLLTIRDVMLECMGGRTGDTDPRQHRRMLTDRMSSTATRPTITLATPNGRRCSIGNGHMR